MNYKTQFAHVVSCKVPRNLRRRIPQRPTITLFQNLVKSDAPKFSMPISKFIDNQLLFVSAVNVTLFDPSSSLTAGMCRHFTKEITSLEFGAAFLQERAKFN